MCVYISQYMFHSLSARIFGEIVRPTDNKSMKVDPPHNTYFTLMKKLRFFGLYRDEHEDFKEEMRWLKKLRSKGKPKKGEGERATEKK
uniref:Small ribosomal subunit protein mS33 n=1 Tax=Chrysemys picta bellii TaxID=8478 RepID=A0A8C3HL13_CHRPI